MRAPGAALLALCISLATSAEIRKLQSFTGQQAGPAAIEGAQAGTAQPDATLAHARRQWHASHASHASHDSRKTGIGRQSRASIGRAASSPFSLPSGAGLAARSALVVDNRWSKIIQEYMRTGETSAMSGMAGQFPQSPVTVDLPVGGGNGRAPETLPVLVLPIPVPVQQCPANYERPISQPLKHEQPALQPVVVDNQVAPPPVPFGIVFPNRVSEPARPVNNYLPSDREPSSQTVSLVSSQQLIEAFRAQQPRSPELPPLVLPHSPKNVVTRGLLDLGRRILGQGEPPKLSFDRSMMMKGHLTVPKADYTEPYTALYDADSGMNRVDMHGGTSSSYRAQVPDGTTLRVMKSLDRTGEKEMRRCVMMRSTTGQTDRAPPVLPDPKPFSFAGYVDMEDGQKAEKWAYNVSGGPGEMGGARDEALTYRHEMHVTRDKDGYNIPLRYAVNVDSSTLGPNSDSYEHQYTRVEQATPQLQDLRIDMDLECDQVEETEDMAKVDPMREYTLPEGDERHNEGILSYASKFARKFIDSGEEAVRKNLLMQTTRFVESANRQAGTAKMGLNFLADRLLSEVEYLTGVVVSKDLRPSEPFPYLRNQLRDVADKLIDRFDWRSQDAVTHVRYQNACKACWAFAVTAAIEGALKVQSGKLVPLSEKALVDCGHKTGANGCGGTWPSRAYDYVRDRGLPSLGEYRKYEPKVDSCEDDRVTPVTFIRGHVNVTRNNIAALKVAIAKHSPTVVTVDGLCYSFLRYTSGVLQDERCSRTAENHAVTAVGYGPNGLNGIYFTLKNSWGTSFGENGFIRVHGTSNTAGVLTRPSYPVLKSEDVRRIPESDVDDPYQDEVGGGVKTR
ncbi:counting factor associated protein D-like isoform X2 [Galleria mellonella]|uniref:Counting factor associated protein D-like isoform X2 n=1 Tax=Galleria mellonella TaxID=7137 RepID=A0A6J1WBK9_GALME|nr:counting factor associated protein D-like isoform X2 [Galleria mellonella]